MGFGVKGGGSLARDIAMTDPADRDDAGGIDFSDEDHLRLLQLMTRRAAAERQARGRTNGGDGGGDGEPPGEEGHRSATPKLWRLIPEGVDLYNWQRECLALWLEHGRGTVKVATGGGKTLFALAAAQRLQHEKEPELRVAVVVPTIPLMYQWYDEVLKGGLPTPAIGLLGAGQSPKDLSEVLFLISVLNSARERLPGLVRAAAWPQRMLLIVDECHRANATQAKKIFDAKPKYTLGISATPEQELQGEQAPDDAAYEESAVGAALGPIIYDFTIRDSLEAGLLTPFEVWHIGLPLTPPEAAAHTRLSREITDLRKALQIRHRGSKSKQGFIAWCQTQASRKGAAGADAERFIGLANRRKRLLYQAEARGRAVVHLLVESAADPESRAIVFHESIAETEALFKQALEHDLPVVLEHSQLPDSLRAESIDAFRRGVARAIVSAKSLIEGFNVPSADLGIIAASSSSVRQRIQSLGRMLRRKTGERTARIIVLYVRDTEDEAIYEKADWERVIGAERNRYFTWHPPGENQEWAAGLNETGIAPRQYRPRSWEIDVTELKPGDVYPGQADGIDLRVDQSDNLRLDDGTLLPAAPELVRGIVERNEYRRARRTPAGHVIVRADGAKSGEPDWRYLGQLDLPTISHQEDTLRFRLKTASGRRVIARADERGRGIRFALGPGRSQTVAGGEARDRILEWVKKIENEGGIAVREVCWDGTQGYWVEVEGQRIPYDGDLAPLEFES